MGAHNAAGGVFAEQAPEAQEVFDDGNAAEAGCADAEDRIWRKRGEVP